MAHLCHAAGGDHLRVQGAGRGGRCGDLLLHAGRGGGEGEGVPLPVEPFLYSLSTIISTTPTDWPTLRLSVLSDQSTPLCPVCGQGNEAV